MSVKTDLKRQIDELAALDTLIWTKRRRAARELLRLRALHPYDWQRLAGVDKATADALLRSIDER